MNLNLTLTTYNCQGLGAGKCEYIRKLSNTCDFILLQEHWLHDGDTLLSRDLPNLRYHLVSGMDSSLVHGGRPYGGCCILWKNNLLASVTPIPVDSKRLCVVKVDCQNYSLLICNAYMTCVKGNINVDQVYCDVLQDISAVCNNNPVYNHWR